MSSCLIVNRSRWASQIESWRALCEIQQAKVFLVWTPLILCSPVVLAMACEDQNRRQASKQKSITWTDFASD